MYEQFFDLTEKPFSIQPDPAFMFWGRNHRLAYSMLEYGVLNNAGISVITGGVGCGKTTLLHKLLDQLTDTHTVALLSNIQPERGNLLSWVLMGFNQSFTNKSHVELFQQLQTFFIGEYSKGRRCVLIIDEAQNLSPDMLEEIRMLSNINAGRDQLLQLILVGQPQLKEILNHPDMLQLTQRIGSDFHLTPLSPDEVHAYIDTRMRVAGASRPIFSNEAKALVAKHSRGVPRVINVLADTALVYAYSAQEETISEKTVASVIEDKQSFGVFGLPRIEDSGGVPAPDYTKHHENRRSDGKANTFTDESLPPLPEESAASEAASAQVTGHVPYLKEVSDGAGG
jgi:type II secretory pathway predicted ATPase ExeA